MVEISHRLRLHAAGMEQAADPSPWLDAGRTCAGSVADLWHLQRLGLPTDPSTGSPEPWTRAEQRLGRGAARTRVALIEAYISDEHPDLRDFIVGDLMVDFHSTRLGTFPSPSPTGAPLAAALSSAPTLRRDLRRPELLRLFEALTGHLAEEYRSAQRDAECPLCLFRTSRPAPCERGTALGGLIGARPALEGEIVTAAGRAHMGRRRQNPMVASIDLPPVGIDPFCEIVPILTGADPDPERLILAVLYAWLIDADVILVPQLLPDPLDLGADGPREPDVGLAGEERRTMEVCGGTACGPEADLWLALRELVEHVSMTIPIVCPAPRGTCGALMSRLGSRRNGVIFAAAGCVAAPCIAGDPPVRRCAQAPLVLPARHSERCSARNGQVVPIAPALLARQRGGAYGLGPQPVEQGESMTANGLGASSRNGVAEIKLLESTDAEEAARSMPAGENGCSGFWQCRRGSASQAAGLAAGLISLAVSAGVLPRGGGAEVKRRLGEGLGGLAHRLEWSRLAGKPTGG